MRFSRSLLAVTAFLAVAALAPTASAEVEGYSEPDDQPCPSVTTTGTDVNGGCLMHIASEDTVELRKHVFGIESHITRCESEFMTRIAQNADGYAFEPQLSTGSTGTCTREACAESAGESTPWPVSANEGTPIEGTEYMTVNFCVEPIGGGTDESCEIDIPFQSSETDHSIEFGHASEIPGHGISGFRCELVGHWSNEVGGTHDGVAIGGGIFRRLSWTGQVTADIAELDFQHTAQTKEIEFTNNTNKEIEIIDVIFEYVSGGTPPPVTRFESPKDCTKAAHLNPGQKCKEKVVRHATGQEAQVFRVRLRYRLENWILIPSRDSDPVFLRN
jgi:hypothetical protein